MIVRLKKIFLRRHLLKRYLRNLVRFAFRKNFVSSSNIDSNSTLPFEWYSLETPIINHPTQAHLMDSKKHNMRLACDQLNSLIIPKNAVLSFWHVIGEPSVKNGHQAGPTFEYGKIVSTYGGGLCQISGLLYNLALYSGLKIHERHPHTIDAYGEKRYLPLGRDATVAFYTKDLCFENDSGSDLQLLISLRDNSVYGEMRAADKLSHSIEIENLTEKVDEKFKRAKVIRKMKNTAEDFGWNNYQNP